ncbi:hypothetical protein J8273_2431 [Carpediemonas membranifera]|uniref:Uncharacterized protein n=1 Tax=Carpediemonas membranifera TaxID=201153 RepID=A0A8J6B7V5_9EUKA|nr:hypothetical protein J8273_2431 [Carpediemonas membranifera]|eukprot:KAG9396079.1 hypothetical protein J8273_2431 [Carpediemonas membranifera]
MKDPYSELKFIKNARKKEKMKTNEMVVAWDEALQTMGGTRVIFEDDNAGYVAGRMSTGSYNKDVEAYHSRMIASQPTEKKEAPKPVSFDDGASNSAMEVHAALSRSKPRVSLESQPQMVSAKSKKAQKRKARRDQASNGKKGRTS